MYFYFLLIESLLLRKEKKCESTFVLSTFRIDNKTWKCARISDSDRTSRSFIIRGCGSSASRSHSLPHHLRLHLWFNMIVHCYVPSGYTVSLSSRTNISLSVLVTYVIWTGFIVASCQKNVRRFPLSVSSRRIVFLTRYPVLSLLPDLYFPATTRRIRLRRTIRRCCFLEGD